MDPQNDECVNFRQNLIRYGGDLYPEIVEKAQGCYVWDSTGKKILDFTSGQMCATVGHSHPNIVAAIKKSCDSALHLFSGMIPRSVVQLAAALAKIVPKPLRKSLLLNTGSESNDAAIKMAKLYTGGFEVIGLGGSWHGVTGNAGSVSYASDRKGYGPGIPGTFVIPEPNASGPSDRMYPRQPASFPQSVFSTGSETGVARRRRERQRQDQFAANGRRPVPGRGR